MIKEYTITKVVHFIHVAFKVTIEQDHLSWEDCMGDCSGSIHAEPKTPFDTIIQGYRDNYYFHMDMDQLIMEFEGDLDKAKETYIANYTLAKDYIQDYCTFVHVSVSTTFCGTEYEDSCGGIMYYFYDDKYIDDHVDNLTAECASNIEKFIANNWTINTPSDL